MREGTFALIEKLASTSHGIAAVSFSNRRCLAGCDPEPWECGITAIARPKYRRQQHPKQHQNNEIALAFIPPTSNSRSRVFAAQGKLTDSINEPSSLYS
jgi:hypothetical protein